MSRGFIVFAFDNEKISYIDMALMCAFSIKASLKNNSISLITDKYGSEALESSLKKYKLKNPFYKIIVIDRQEDYKERLMRDGPWYSFKAPFLNDKRYLSYKLSPYDETIVLDTDYIVYSDYFDKIWGNKKDIMINKKCIDNHGNKINEELTKENSSIPMYWATIVYFKKTKYAKAFFDLTEFISENYLFYKYIYNFSGVLYRNDFVFSIAVHILNGFIDTDEFVFPGLKIKTLLQVDEITFMNKDKILCLTNVLEKPWINILTKIEKKDIHITNKKALLRNLDNFLKDFNE